ncbi:MAG: hypothetical protein Q9227_007344 [Pyrenula ochraceoflavens]
MNKFRTVFKFKASSLRKFQVLSDLHLEVGKQYSSFEIPVSARHLILAGDIGRLIDYDGYLQFLCRQVTAYDAVFLVLGNHEFYGLTYDEGIEKAKKLAAEPTLSEKVILMHRVRYDLPGSLVTILGCTMWSRVHEEVADIVRLKVNDFQKIQDWSVKRHNAVFNEELAWLQSQFKKIRTESPRRKIIVVTHHAPTVKKSSRPEHVNNSWTSAFATDILDRHGLMDPDLWIFGHTHFTTAFKLGSTNLLSNQRGYVLPGQISPSPKIHKDGFDVCKSISV